MKKFLSKSLIGFGFICIILTVFLYWQRTTPKRLKFNIDTVNSNSSISNTKIYPKVLIIKDLGIKLEIYPTEIKNGRWQATSKGVSYLATSPVPADVGNSILYGHNWRSLLGGLVNAKPGQEVEIIFSDGTSKRFVIQYTQVVTPDQTEILENTEDRRITLYTCTGFLDSKRFVITAIYQNPV